MCKDSHSFVAPEHLIQAFHSGDAVIFAGAGISTESRHVLRDTLYDRIAVEVGLKSKIPFPDLMEQFSKRPNGRTALISKIRDRFEYIYAFPELDNRAKRFHRELATFPAVSTYVTTNWDTYFESECSATPFVISADIAFWDSAERKVLKIHGSITNPSTIIASRSDYEAAEIDLHKSLIGSVLKTLLATRTIIFMGYSLRDEDFQSVLEFTRSELGEFTRTAYIVTIENSQESRDRFEQFGLTPVITDAQFFLEQMKIHLNTVCKNMIPDEVFDEVSTGLQFLDQAHDDLFEKYSVSKNPEIVLCACYQDGMRHGLERILRLRASGKYSNRARMQAVFRGYLEWRKSNLKKKKYDDVAYIDGYLAAMSIPAFFGMKDWYVRPPLFYGLNVDKPLYTITQFRRAFKEIREAHKAGFKFSQKVAKKFASYPKGTVLHHSCEVGP
jgi:hypothetical protein